MSNLVLQAKSLSKIYTEGPADVVVLDSIDLAIEKAERIAIVGASGSGKSTLLHLLGGLDTATHGSICVYDQDFSKLTQAKRARLRNQYLGFVYQFHHLLPEFSALENVAMPLLIAGISKSDALAQAGDILSKVGLQERLQHRPAELSGGERQRTAIARAMVTKPHCLLADEPTGNLDTKTASSVFELMLAMNAESGSAVVMVTHDNSLAQQMDVVYQLQNRRLERVK